jgi:hypothetical protein
MTRVPSAFSGRNFDLSVLVTAAPAEGHEYKVFSDWSSSDSTLPQQIAVEFHFANNKQSGMAQTGAEMILGFMHLARLGYAAFSIEINAIVPHCCSEFSFVKIV